MAIIIDKSKIKDIKNPVRNKEKQIFIGLKIPLSKSNGPDGFFESTTTSIKAAKEDIRNLINTRKGERLFNPTIGLNLDEFLFENITEEIVFLIREDIENTFKFWLPFIGIYRLDVTGDDNNNSMNIDIQFFMKSNPNQIESIQLEI